MKHSPALKLFTRITVTLLSLGISFASAQPSVGRGAPAPLKVTVIVGADGKGLYAGPGEPEGLTPVIAAQNGDVPEGIEALDRDIFTTRDFYKDIALWSDPRYFRCNAPMALEAQWGAYEVPVVGDNPPYSGAWGYCDRDYPREEIISPYGFNTAQAHYQALLEETTAKGGPTIYTQATLPDWNGTYLRSRDKTESWYGGSIVQTSTYLSLLTPDYQQHFVQQMYHYSATNASQWPGSYCWPEGFMRRFSEYGGGIDLSIMMTPQIVQDLRGGTQNYLTQIHIGREFDVTGVVPRLGVDIPRWYGETIGFWDGEALISWTSNIQGWISHGSFEYSNKMQSIEIYTPNKDAQGKIIGLTHEIILYDEEALLEPVRIIVSVEKIAELGASAPVAFAQCIQNNFPLQGAATPVSPGDTIEYTVPDMYDRPWAELWERYYEDGMERPQEEALFGF